MAEWSIRPLKAGESVKNKDGSSSTERTATVMLPGGWANVPTLWMAPNGPIDLRKLNDDQIAELARHYETESGVTFKRFRARPSAEAAAKARSDQGGAGSPRSPYQGELCT